MIIFNDLKYAIRLLLKKPAFTMLTIMVMATGIGLSVYLFSMENTMLFKPLPFKNGSSLVVMSASQNGKKSNDELDLHDYYEIKTSLEGLSEFGAYKNLSVNVSGRDGARKHNATLTEPNLFQITRTEPILGRGFTASENQTGAEKVVVIGYDLWQQRFAASEEVIDQILQINDESHRIIGVMPQGYVFPNFADMWLPLRQDATRLLRGEGKTFHGLAHIDDDFSMQDINNQLAIIMQRLKEKYPKTNSDISAYIHTLQLAGVGDSLSQVYTMYVIAILILVLASINVGNLLLSRAIERKKETAVRMALGAPRSRLISQMLWESIIICCLGGLIGLLGVVWGLDATQSITRTFFFDNPRFWWQFGLDDFTLIVFASIVIITILITGLLPVWKNTGGDFNANLRDGTRGALGKNAGRLNKFLVISEIFLCLTVLIAVTVKIVEVYNATQADYGADPTSILTAKVRLSSATYDTPEKQIQFTQTLQSRLEQNNEISDVTIASGLPGEWTDTLLVAIEGNEYSKERGYPRANYITITPGGLDKLGVSLKKGRYFSSADDGSEKKSVIVTDSFAALHFPNQSAIGKRLRLVDRDGDTPNWLNIVGIVKHTIQGDPSGQSGRLPSVFRPYSQDPGSYLTLGIKMKADSSLVTQTLRKTLASINPSLPAYRVEVYPKKISRNVAHKIWIATVYLAFGVAAIILAVSGIYGVMSNTIVQRTQEIGVKRALGALDNLIIIEFMKSSFKQLLLGGIPGFAAGCALAFVITRYSVQGYLSLFSIAIIITVIISFVVILGTYLPTKRALQIEPSEALRDE